MTTPAPLLQLPFERGQVRGMKTILIPTPGCRLFAADFVTLRGSVDEREGEHGLAAFTQEMLMRGTRLRSSKRLAFDLESIGAMTGANEGSDRCNLSIRTAAAEASEGMAILLEILGHPAFDPAEHEIQRRETLASLRRIEDDKFGFTYREYLKTIFAGHGYGHSSEGEIKDAERITPKDCCAWHGRVTRPEDMIFVAAGDFDVNALVRQLDMALASWSGEEWARPRESAATCAGEPASLLLTRPGLKQAFIVTGFRTPPMTHPDYPALRLASAVLGEGFGGRIFTNLRDKQSLAYACGSLLRSYRLGGHQALYIGTKPETRDVAREGLLNEARGLCETAPSPADLERAREYVIGKFLMGHQSLGQKAALIAGWEDSTGDGSLAAQWPDRLRMVTPEAVRAAAEKWWVKPTVVELIPE